MKYIKRQIYWEEPVEQNQYLTVSYRRKIDPNPNNFTIIAESLLATTEGVLPTPLEIEFPDQGTEYVVRYSVNGYETFYDEEVKTPTEFEVVGPIDTVHNVMPLTEYTYPITGMKEAHLPSVGTIYELNDSLSASTGTSNPLILSGPAVFEERLGIKGIKLSNLSTLTFPAELNQLSVLGINEQQGMKDYTLGFWFHMTASEFAMVQQGGKKWLLYSGDETNHFGLFIDSVTGFINWEFKKGATVERVILDTQILPETWTKVCVRRKGNDTNNVLQNQLMVSFNGVDHISEPGELFTSAINFTGSSLNPVYVGSGRNNSGTIMPSYGIYSKLYYLEGNITDELRLQLQNPVYPRIILDGLSETVVSALQINDDSVVFTVPEDTEDGTVDVFVRSFQGDSDPVLVNVHPIEKDDVGFEIDFADDADDARELLTDKFWTVESDFDNLKAESRFVYVEQDKLAMEAHSVNVDRNVGSVIASKDYLGFGSYKVRAALPSVDGLMFSMWISSNDSEYSFVGTEQGSSAGVNHIVYNVATSSEAEYDYHDHEIRWYADSVELYTDDVLNQTISTLIPQNIGRLCVAFWCPDQDAIDGFNKVLIENISFEPFTDNAGGQNTQVGEARPYDGFIEISS